MNFSRILYKDIVIYIEPDIPYWFVPNKAGDEFFKEFLKTEDIYSAIKKIDLPLSSSAISAENFLNHIKNFCSNYSKEYSGRINYIDFSYPKEAWFHITNRCNLNCAHCLFSEFLNNNLEMDSKFLIKIIDELNSLGTNVFVFTGGEPLIYPDLDKVLKYILEKSENNKIAILTNGLFIEKFYEKIKDLDLKRIHFQISCEGIFENYEKVRKVSFKKFLNAIRFLQKKNLNFTIGIDLIDENIEKVIDFFLENGVKFFHFFYHIPYGNGKKLKILDIDLIAEKLIRLKDKCDKVGAEIDNFTSLEAQIFTYCGVKHDLTSAGIELIAISPDMKVYPTAATVFQDNLCCGDLKKDSFISIWNNSKILNELRKKSVIEIPELSNSPFKFIHGGGDFDLSYFYDDIDPFIPLYEEIIKFLIYENVKKLNIPERKIPEIILEAGDILKDCGKKGEVFLNHSNCLLSMVSDNGIEIVQNFYKKAATEGNEDILNPFIGNLKIKDVPDENLLKSFGCGSPVIFANLEKGDKILDIGCGSGVETLIASDEVGVNGTVVGIDMLDEMLNLANKAKKEKKKENLFYIKGFIDKLPFKDESFDVIISNCVINLSDFKKIVFKEIYRILKFNGRIVISDVVSEKNLPSTFMQDEKLKGECLSGALTEEKLIETLRILNFKNIKILSRTFYRKVEDFKFFSITFSAEKIKCEKKYVYFPGPSIYYVDENFNLVKTGEINEIESVSEDTPLFIFDETKENVINKEMYSCCAIPQENKTGCLICGEELVYFNFEKERTCFMCGKKFLSNAECKNGHFICDECHSNQPVFKLINYLENCDKKDLIEIFYEAKNYAKFPMHGPEYHALVPGVILTSFKNNGGNISFNEIKSAILRGKKVPGGSCGFNGVCGVVTGIGIALSAIIKSTPLKAKERKITQSFCAKVLDKISKLEAARCCQRETYIGLKLFSENSEWLTGINLPADFKFSCSQSIKNPHCIKEKCPLFKNFSKLKIPFS